MLSDAELLARQDRLQAEACDFLELHRVERLLAPAGRIIVVGSYVTGLMVCAGTSTCASTPLASSASGRGKFVRPLVLVADRVRYEHLHETDDRRHYFVLRLGGWKLDLSLFTDGLPPEVEGFQNELRSRLDDDMRLAILRLKEAWHARPEYPETIGGFEICSRGSRRRAGRRTSSRGGWRTYHDQRTRRRSGHPSPPSRALCAGFLGEYWRALEPRRYPESSSRR